MLNKNPDPLEKQVKYAELKLAGFVAAHDESFLKMDHLTDVLKDIFPDSKIAKGLSLKRTKTRGLVVNVIGEAEKEELVATLKTTKFSILTDESTDISAVKTAAIMVQYYCPVAKGIVVRHWELDDIFTEDDPEVDGYF
ncbi:uncharacterized protein LOC127751482 [Frankliniella occidentalis]|uniref:Uncharacterized protein LOC127751482 n=1 Tax=Frankliniella occidentalis TaxID=133901 RepID=A0A9C6XUH9_FRAOC|nr:uncharacterized protein LOC127751482 [Frankliniella occidentalis]